MELLSGDTVNFSFNPKNPAPPGHNTQVMHMLTCKNNAYQYFGIKTHKSLVFSKAAQLRAAKYPKLLPGKLLFLRFIEKIKQLKGIITPLPINN